MEAPPQLWKMYHEAIENNDRELAKRILLRIQSMKSNPAFKQSGCSGCRKRI